MAVMTGLQPSYSTDLVYSFLYASHIHNGMRHKNKTTRMADTVTVADSSVQQQNGLGNTHAHTITDLYVQYLHFLVHTIFDLFLRERKE